MSESISSFMRFVDGVLDRQVHAAPKVNFNDPHIKRLVVFPEKHAEAQPAYRKLGTLRDLMKQRAKRAQKAQELYDAGETLANIATRLGVHEATVTGYIKHKNRRHAA